MRPERGENAVGDRLRRVRGVLDVETMKRLPDILFIMADQWAAGSVGCYGCDVPGVTPGLNALANRGIRFDRHYANCPVCGPSRATIFTGRSPAVHGVVRNNLEMRGDVPVFTQCLKEWGYRTTGFGKFHFTPMDRPPPTSLSRLGFDEVVVTEDPKLGAWLDWIEKEHPEHYEKALAMSWNMPYMAEYGPARSDLVPAWKAAHKKWLEPAGRPPHRWIFAQSPLPMELHQTRWITDLAIREMDRPRGEQPAFTFVSYVDPHDPYDPPAPYADLFDWRDLPPPVPQEWTRDWCLEEYARFQDEWFDLGTFTPETWSRLRSRFYGSCRFVDDEIGRLLRHLERSGRAEHTVVVFTTDHGDLIGDHGLLMKGPWHYDKCIRCPLILAGPGIPAGAVCRELTSTLDFFPTIVRVAGRVPGVPLEGRAIPVSPPAMEDWRGCPQVAIETNGCYVRTEIRARSVVTEDGWRLTVFPGREYGEMFDLKNDPREQRNLFRSPSKDDQRRELMERLSRAVSA